MGHFQWKTSDVLLQDEDEDFLQHYDYPDAMTMNDPATFYPSQDTEQSVSLHSLFRISPVLREEKKEEESGEEPEPESELESDRESFVSSHLRGSEMLSMKQAKSYTSELDKLADDIESNFSEYGLNRREARDICYRIDYLSDKIERTAAKKKEAVGIETEEDEPYMDWYDVGGVVDDQQDADEPYMDQFDVADAENQFGAPLEGETERQLKNSPPMDQVEETPRQASEDNWYERSKREASGDNWYERSKRQDRTSSSDDNWYERSKKKSSETADNWYDRGR